MGNLSKLLVVCAAAACTSAAAILVHQYVKRLQWQASVSKFLGEVQESFSTDKQRLLEIADAMKTEMVNGLKPPGTCLRMLPSYVDNLPNGCAQLFQTTLAMTSSHDCLHCPDFLRQPRLALGRR